MNNPAIATIQKSKQKIAAFLILTFLLSSIFYYQIIKAGSMEAGYGLYVLGLMWCPGISAISVQLIFEKRLSGLGWKPGKFKFLALSYCIPIVYALAIYLPVWISGLGGFPNLENIQANLPIPGASPFRSIVFYVLFCATIGVASSLISALGEEIGWRGLLVPELAHLMDFTKVALLSGVIWAIWHYPLLLFADYNMQGAPAAFALICFTITVVAISFIFAWLRLKSGSLWTAALFHASHNLFIQAVFTPLTIPTRFTPYLIDEFGIGMAITTVIAAYIFWRLRAHLPQDMK